MEPKKNDKNAMIKAYKQRNAEMNNQNQELKGTVAALIKQRDEALELARKRGEELEGLKSRVKKFERPSRVAVWEVSAPEGAVAAVRTVRSTARKEKELPLGQQVQAAVAHFLRDFGFEPSDPRRIAWDRAYKINGALMNGEYRFTPDEILAAADWLKYSLGEQRYSIAQTRKYLESLVSKGAREYLDRPVATVEDELLRAARCELELLKLAQEPGIALKTDDGRVEATA